MKAAVCYEFGKPLHLEEIEIDPPQTDEVKVKIAACAICHSDIHYIDGAWGGTLPAVYGHEAAGIVTEVGAGVSQVKPGDAVVVSLLRSCGRCFYCAQGDSHLCEGKFALDQSSRLHSKTGSPIVQGMRTAAFAEYVVVEQSQVVRVPDGMALDSASLLACGVITGLGAVTNTAQIPFGSSVVVIGAGGVGLNSIQGAKLAGAHAIIAIDLLDSKLEAAKHFGATHTVNSKTQDAESVVKTLTQGRGADYVFVTVGNARAMEQGIQYLRRAGTLVIVGMPASGAKSQFEMGDFAGYGQRILGSKMGSTRLQVDVPKLVQLYEQGELKLDELISGRYPLEEINEAIDAVKRGAALRNVIVF
jgi:Zn-dependent alcohol dehydrogenase